MVKIFNMWNKHVTKLGLGLHELVNMHLAFCKEILVPLVCVLVCCFSLRKT